MSIMPSNATTIMLLGEINSRLELEQDITHIREVPIVEE